VAPAKARDRAVIRPLVRGDHAERDVIDARPLDHPRRAATGGVGVEQQRHHHRRIVGRPAVSVLAVTA
jgi:hypothetical protein